jgi:L-aspartate oxidase
LVATGGAGHVYKNTTNPIIATGDGIAFVHRAQGKVSNMQYYQFHPTAMYSKRDGMLFLISSCPWRWCKTSYQEWKAIYAEI